MIFRWVLGFLIPIFIVALPSIAHIMSTGIKSKFGNPDEGFLKGT